MAKSGESTFVVQKGYRTGYIVVPAAVAGDSVFPFKAGDRVTVLIADGHLEVRKIAEALK